jgi:hypothetical protein
MTTSLTYFVVRSVPKLTICCAESDDGVSAIGEARAGPETASSRWRLQLKGEAAAAAAAAVAGPAVVGAAVVGAAVVGAAVLGAAVVAAAVVGVAVVGAAVVGDVVFCPAAVGVGVAAAAGSAASSGAQASTPTKHPAASPDLTRMLIADPQAPYGVYPMFQ